MIPELNEKLTNELKHFYNKLIKVASGAKIKLIKDSIFITIIKLPTNKISKLMSDSALSNQAFFEADLRELLKGGFICEANNIEKRHEYNITALGIWIIETQLGKVDILKLLEFYQNYKYSSDISEKPLDSKEKIILLSMIAMRNFSSDAAMNLSEMGKSDDWIDIFNEMAWQLNSKGIIGKLDWIPLGAGNEHPINYIMRRAQDLPQKTKHVFKFAGNSRYYLDINSTSKEQKIKLIFLFSIIYSKIESKADIKNIHSFLCKSAYDKGKNVRESFEYIDHEWDTIIEESLNDFYYEQ